MGQEKKRKGHRRGQTTEVKRRRVGGEKWELRADVSE